LPLLQNSEYRHRPFYMLNGHMETIIPSMFFESDFIDYDRERLELTDGDFLDLDWLRRRQNDHLLIITHGLEGSSDRYYVKRMAHFFHDLGWDILAWNCRSCSGEMNRLIRFYHHGDTEDLSVVIDHAIVQNKYKSIVLSGSSMGGSMSIKYLGEKRRRYDVIKAAVTFSVPCNLKDSAEQLQAKSNRFYERRFVKKLVEKVKKKSDSHLQIDTTDIESIDNFNAFHRRFTLPVYGFSSIDDFYEQATCDQYLEGVEIPLLIVNAQNDPMLGDKCYPIGIIEDIPNVFLEIPKVGGHVGFTIWRQKFSYMELRMKSFLESVGITAQEPV
jgi:predicted alpha/beta-fold hydrolase